MKMKQERAIQRKVLTQYETAIVDKINSRIEFLDFIKKGIQFYGFEKYESEIKGLKLEKQLDSEPMIKVPYNLNKGNEITEKINEIIKVCMDLYEDKTLSLSDVISLKYRGDVTTLRVVMMNLIVQYTNVSPTVCGKVFNRSRQICHMAINELKTHLFKNKTTNLLNMYNKMNAEVANLFKITTHEPKLTLRQQKIKTNENNLQNKVNQFLNIITKKVFDYNKNKINFTPNSNNKEVISKQTNYDFRNSIIISSINNELNRDYISDYFNVTKKQIAGILLNHSCKIKKEPSYKRKFNLIQKNILEDKTYLKAKSILDNYIKNQK